MKKYILFFGMVIICATLDIISKNLVFSHFQVIIEGENKDIPQNYSLYSGLYLPKNPRLPIVLIPNCLDLIISFNRGAVWGSFQGFTPFLSIFSVVALIVILVIIFCKPLKPTLMIISFGFIAAGASGNLWDRLNFNGVRDFIHLYIKAINFHWPTFNLADVWIVLGIAGFLYLEIKRKDQKQ